MSEKKQAVLDALDELFGDTSVSHRETLDALEEIASEVDTKIEVIKGDMAGEDND